MAPIRGFPALLLLPLLLAGLTACAAPAGSPPPAREGTAVVTLASEGGIAGLRREITVRSDGMLIVRDLRRGTEVAAALTPAELQEIESLVAALPQPPAARPTSCPDCILHVLTPAGADRPRPIALPAPLEPASPYRPLLERLLELAASIQQAP